MPRLSTSPTSLTKVTTNAGFSTTSKNAGSIKSTPKPGTNPRGPGLNVPSPEKGPRRAITGSSGTNGGVLTATNNKPEFMRKTAMNNKYLLKIAESAASKEEFDKANYIKSSVYGLAAAGLSAPLASFVYKKDIDSLAAGLKARPEQIQSVKDATQSKVTAQKDRIAILRNNVRNGVSPYYTGKTVGVHEPWLRQVMNSQTPVSYSKTTQEGMDNRSFAESEIRKARERIRNIRNAEPVAIRRIHKSLGKKALSTVGKAIRIPALIGGSAALSSYYGSKMKAYNPNENDEY